MPRQTRHKADAGVVGMAIDEKVAVRRGGVHTDHMPETLGRHAGKMGPDTGIDGRAIDVKQVAIHTQGIGNG